MRKLSHKIINKMFSFINCCYSVVDVFVVATKWIHSGFFCTPAEVRLNRFRSIIEILLMKPISVLPHARLLVCARLCYFYRSAPFSRKLNLRFFPWRRIHCRPLFDDYGLPISWKTIKRIIIIHFYCINNSAYYECGAVPVSAVSSRKHTRTRTRSTSGPANDDDDDDGNWGKVWRVK